MLRSNHSTNWLPNARVTKWATIDGDCLILEGVDQVICEGAATIEGGTCVPRARKGATISVPARHRSADGRGCT